MKKVSAFLLSVIIIISIITGLRIGYQYRINNDYCDEIASMLTDEKFTNLSLQEAAIKNGDNLMMYGSSEFESMKDNFVHPNNYFANKKNGFIVNLNGRGGYKTLVHATDIGALGKKLKGQKVAIVLSEQWFYKDGIDEKTYEANSSKRAALGFLLNSSLSRELKAKFANRILDISEKNPNEDWKVVHDFCKLYKDSSIKNKALTFLMTPYYYGQFQLMYLRDQGAAISILNKIDNKTKNTPKQSTKFNWNEDKIKADKAGKETSTNNKYYMDDKAYSNLTDKKYGNLKDSQKNKSVKESPEYDDYKILLETCKDIGIEPLIIVTPVNGRWYDYIALDKSEREFYYKKVRDTASEYNFKVADFSDKEYEKYFLKDNSHLGWKGWLEINEALDKYYNES